MSALQDVREAVCALLEGVQAWTVYNHVPERLSAPAAVLTPGDPYLTTEGQPFGGFAARWTITLVADVATNDVATEQLDTMIEDAIVALVNGGVHAETVGEPFVFVANDQMHLAADLAATTTITL